jgi:hypothetical protein
MRLKQGPRRLKVTQDNHIGSSGRSLKLTGASSQVATCARAFWNAASAREGCLAMRRVRRPLRAFPFLIESGVVSYRPCRRQGGKYYPPHVRGSLAESTT